MQCPDNRYEWKPCHPSYYRYAEKAAEELEGLYRERAEVLEVLHRDRAEVLED